MKIGTHLLLAHEMPGGDEDDNARRHAIPFGELLQAPSSDVPTTPQSLLDANIYAEIAVPIKAHAFRPVGLWLLAQGLAANLFQKQHVLRSGPGCMTC